MWICHGDHKYQNIGIMQESFRYTLHSLLMYFILDLLAVTQIIPEGEIFIKILLNTEQREEY